MANMNDQPIKEIKVIGVEKPQKGKFQEHFEYVIRVTYENGHEHLIFRRYSMLFHFHSVLKEVVKGNYSSVIILPELPVARFQHVGRKFLRLGMNKELKQMTEFCQKIVVLPKFISEKDIILKFFDQLGTDVAHSEAYLEESQKGEQSKEQNDRVPPQAGTDSCGDMGQDNMDQYRSIAEFDAVGTGELSVVEGEIVTVIEKNTSGWWLVSNQSGHTGFTPATFLEPVEEKTNTGEWHIVSGPDNMYTAVKDYEAQCEDEISFRFGEEMEVLAMSNFGWWQVRCNDQVGLCPASSLTIRLASSYYEDPMIEYRKSILKYSTKGSQREAPPRTGSSKSCDSQSSSDGSFYGNAQQPERFCPPYSSAKYTKIIPKHLRYEEPNNNNNDKINYVNIPVIKNGTPHYEEGQESEAINVHVLRRDYQENGFSLRKGDTVQVMAVMPDGCFWKVATLTRPFKEGLIPSDLLCPELPRQIEAITVPSSTAGIVECTVTDGIEPLKVLPRFTAPPSVRKPVPAPRSNPPKSPTVSPKGVNSVVALVDYNPGQTDLLSFQKGDVGRLVKKAETGWWFIELKGFEGWVPVVYWEECKEGRNGKTPDISLLGLGRQWFCGKMSREQCEDLFGKRGKHLDFIIRESVQRVGSYALSIKFNDKIHHFPIEKSASGKLQIGKLSFDKLSEIVTHYKIHPLFYTDNRQPVSVGKPLSRT
ncbi:SH3 and PX domain-containing 2A isoform X7 [Paramuricea clavata]|uniref:SH3 and PX domain-containing 2A isoform X7 n=1 Tax=Paramuricea clavata TaxID=317549 RepID=A0A6S7HIC8_PARCT|nr:SH3 and PX domain-containing 2A isoform X7 [Paramuricea clavata]